MLELVGVGLTAGARTRLDRMEWAARAGEVLGLAGSTAAGKTSALVVAAGEAVPDRGRVRLEGRDVSRKPARLRAACALAGEALPGPYDLTAQQWLETWMALDAVPGKVRAARIDGGAAQFGLAAVLGAPVSALSAGERRRLGLVRAFARQPKVLLLDAPEQALDGAGLRALSQAIRAVAADGGTVIIASGAPHLITAVCDRVVLLAAGSATGEVRRGEADFDARIAKAQGWAA